MNKGTSKGIAALGSWIMDHVRMVDIWPEEETLSYIYDEKYSGGGLAHNAVIDLARFDLGIPIEAHGILGDDDDGRRLVEECDRYGVDREHLVVTDQAPTSYTEVITVRTSGKRTFFHSKGANNLLTYDNVPFDEIEAGMVHFGYLLLMDGIDAPDRDFGTVGAKILHELQRRGKRTSVDTVSESSERFPKIMTPALEHTDYVILNELEAGRTTGHTVIKNGSIDSAALKACAEGLMSLGKTKCVVIHMHLGAYAVDREGHTFFQPSLDVPDEFVKGGAGAGDAFCAGVLAGIHEGWDLDQSLKFGTAAGAACLNDPTCTEGVLSAQETWKLFDRFPTRTIKL